MSGALLPNAHLAGVPHAKVHSFLLAPNHPDNNGRAAFFNRFGFTIQNWTDLRDALRKHPNTNNAVKVTNTKHGTKFEVRCSLLSPDKRNPCIRSLWIFDAANSNPRL